MPRIREQFRTGGPRTRRHSAIDRDRTGTVKVVERVPPLTVCLARVAWSNAITDTVKRKVELLAIYSAPHIAVPC